VSTATARWHVDALAGRCYLGLDAATLRDDVLRGLRKIVSVDAVFFATVDPATMLYTSALTEEPLFEARGLFLDNEFGRADVNKFTELAAATGHVSSLDRATSDNRRDSPRYLEVMAPLGLGDELRAALVAAGHCWGVMCLHRLDALSGFTSEEIALVRRLVPHLAEGLRRAIVAAAVTSPQPGVRGPGVIVLNEDLSVSSMNTQAEQWMADLRDPRWMDLGCGSLPTAIYVAARRATYPDPAVDATAVTRVRTGGGDWLSIHASRLGGPAGQQTAVVVESAQPVQMASLYLDAHGLTPAQSRVAALVLQGRSTRQIVNELHISPYTVQEHLRAVFEKFGIGSRRELVAALLGPSA
jgi:DNA-binding CsgD family transcriptional regulator